MYSKNKISEKLVEEFFAAIPEKFKYVEFGLHEGNHIGNKKIELKEKKYQLLDLKENYETIHNNFSDNCKRNVKKAIKSGLKIRPDISPEKIVSLFKTTKGDELDVFKAGDYKVLIELMDVCLSRNKGQSIGVYDGNELCAAGFFYV